MTNQKFSNKEKDDFERQCERRCKSTNEVLRGTNKLEKAKTKENAAAKMMDENEVNYNPQILLKVVQALLHSPFVKEKLKKIINAKKPSDLEGQEIEFRNFLFGLASVFCGGQRVSVLMNMLWKEFKKMDVSHGCEVIKVAHHKTAPTLGAATLVFTFPKLYFGIHKFVQLFR